MVSFLYLIFNIRFTHIKIKQILNIEYVLVRPAVSILLLPFLSWEVWSISFLHLLSPGGGESESILYLFSFLMVWKIRSKFKILKEIPTSWKKKIQALPRLEPRTFRVAARDSNHYTTPVAHQTGISLKLFFLFGPVKQKDLAIFTWRHLWVAS